MNSKKILKISILTIVFLSLVITCIVFFLRIQYPYQLEWMEGGEIEHIIRLVEGKKIYCEPSLDFIPYIYTPFYYYIGFLLSLINEPNFFILRLVSVSSFFISLFFIYKIITHYTNDKILSFVGVGIFTLSYSTTGFWFDIARVDTTANLFMIISFYLLLCDKKENIYLSSFFSFLSFYTKQSFVVVSISLVFALFFFKRQYIVRYSVFFLALVLITTIVETIISDGWYIFWNFYFPASHHWIFSRAITFWTIDVLPFYSISLAVIIAYFFIKGRKIFKDNDVLIFFLFFGTLINAYFSRLHYGGYLNVIIPFASAISICFPIVLYKLLTITKQDELIEKIFYSLILFQFMLLFYDPIFPIPREKDKKDVEQILTYAQKSSGEVYLMGYNFVQRGFGLKSRPHYVLLNDLFISKVPQKNALIQEFIANLKQKKFSAIILDEDLSLDFLDNYYYKSNIVFYHRVFNSKQSPFRKEIVWLPK
ncbi:MAG: glycosyltransferase family 39 protein [Ignavibacteria bacterium]|nr:glycosyltransferase family 39 protein [Ignavibacteria bacterium]